MQIFHPCKKCIVQFMCKDKCDNAKNYMKFIGNDSIIERSFIMLSIIYWALFIYLSIGVAWWWILIPAIISVVSGILCVRERTSLTPYWESILIGACLIPALIICGLCGIAEWYYYKHLPEELN